MERRDCFGTREYSRTSYICRGCESYKECGLKWKIESKKSKIEILRKRDGKWQKGTMTKKSRHG